VTSSRDANLRISPHCYNSTEDVHAILDGLRRHRGLLVGRR
jgi:selenocysteine lyase/cysteine desulfurase